MVKIINKILTKKSANKGQLWSQFYEYKFNQSQDMLPNITSVESLVRQSKDLEETITEVQTTNKIVSILPTQYKHFRIVWDTYKESEQTVELLTLRDYWLKKEESRWQKEKLKRPIETNLLKLLLPLINTEEEIIVVVVRLQTTAKSNATKQLDKKEKCLLWLSQQYYTLIWRMQKSSQKQKTEDESPC